MVFSNCRADPYLWMHENNKEDVSEYLECVILYVNDLLNVSCHPEGVMKLLDRSYSMKEYPVNKKSFVKPTH